MVQNNFRLTVTTIILLFIFLFVGMYLELHGTIVTVGSGSYTTDLFSGANPPQYQNGSIAYPSVTANVSAPVPTNDWWTSLVYKNNIGNNYSEVLAAHPFMLKCNEQGLGIGVTGSPVGNYSYPYNEEFVVGINDVSFANTLLDDYGDWTVNAEWENGANRLNATFGHGLSYVYFTKTGGNANLDFISSPSVWYNENGVLGITINGHHYGIFAPSGSSWSISGDVLQSSLNGNDYFSVAALPDNSTATLNYFKAHAYAFITDSQVSWNYDENNTELTSTYQVTTQIKEGVEDQALLALYRHQWLNCSETYTSYTFASPRGTMKLLEGNTFSTDMTFMGILPGFPDELAGSSGYSQSQLEGYIQDLANQSINQLIPWGDTYFHGKDLGKIAQVVRVADQIGNINARDYFINSLKSRLENWLTASVGETSNLFYYNETWGSLVGYPSSFASDTQLNDHHFHWGYFIMAAAVIAQYDVNWASETSWGGMINILIRDVAAWDRADPLFPFLRYYDIYAGHSWAGGHGATSDGNNQESSSEALNFSAAVTLWGSVLGNDEIRDLGIFLYTNEYTAVEQYWFDVDNEVFPVSYSHNCLGILWGTGGSHSTWFSGDPEMIHGINYLPLTSASLYLGRNTNYVMDNYNEMVAENGGAEDVWYDIIWEYLALANPTLALSKFNDYPSYPEEGGETKAHTYYWLHNMKSMGQVDLSITANVPNYAVFINNGTRTYAAYNPTFSDITVQFSDGETLDVPVGELVSSNTIVSVNVPSEAAPVPPHDEVSNGVISIYSDVYSPILGVDYNPDWGQSTIVTIDEAISGDNTLKYENLNYQGTDWNGNPQDVSDLEFLHIDFWTANSNELGIFLISGVFPNITEIEYEFDITELQWNSLEIPLSYFSNGGVNLVDARQFKVLGNGDVWFDNLYFYTEQVNPTVPVTAAPVPSQPTENVISLFSNSYINVNVDTWSAEWDQADVSDVQINGNDTKLYTNLNYAGIEFTSQTIDVSEMTYFHLDVWTPDNTSAPAIFKVKLVDFGADGSYGGDDDLEHEIIFDENTMSTGVWVGLDIHLSEFTNLTTTEHLAQLLISGDPNTIYVDNVYFYSEVLEAPTNVILTVSLAELTISWDSVIGATSYIVYSSDTPNGIFIPVTGGLYDGPSWTSGISDTSKFYFVTAKKIISNAKIE